MIPCLCAHTRRAARLLTLLYDAELAPGGMSASQFELLTLLSHGERNGRSIARLLSLDTTTVSRNLKSLLASGLVAAKASPQDGRQVLYSLTTDGRVSLRKAQTLWKRAQAKVESHLKQPTARVLQTLTGLSRAAAPPATTG